MLTCANVANLQLARGLARGRDLATHLALGATRGRVIRQLLLEGLMLSAVAGVPALLIGVAVPSLILARLDTSPPALQFGPDVLVVLFLLGLCVVTTVAFALMPAVQLTRRARSLHEVLQGGRTWRHRIGTLRAGNLGLQLAISATLLVSALLLSRGLHHAVDIDTLGFNTEVGIGVLRPPSGAPELDANRRRQILSAVLSSGGSAAALASRVPLAREYAGLGPEEVRLLATHAEAIHSASVLAVSPTYFDVLRIPLIAGRRLRDDVRGEVLVNDAFARGSGLAPSSLIGQSIVIGHDVGDIVGVVADARLESLDDALPTVFRVLRESDAGMVTLLARDDLATEKALTNVARAVAPEVRLSWRPLTGVLDIVTRANRIGTALAAVIGAIALLVTVVGVFGVFAYAVEERRREIGVRVALGARRHHVLTMIYAGLRAPGAIGVGMGLLFGSLTGTVLRSSLFGLSPLDPFSYGAALLILIVAAAVASYLPARSALRVQPALTLRAE